MWSSRSRSRSDSRTRANSRCSKYRKPPCIRRVEAAVVPPPMSSLSRRKTRRPRIAASRAIPAPLMPPPMTITSKEECDSLCISYGGSLVTLKAVAADQLPARYDKAFLETSPSTRQNLASRARSSLPVSPILKVDNGAHAKTPSRKAAGGDPVATAPVLFAIPTSRYRSVVLSRNMDVPPGNPYAKNETPSDSRAFRRY